MTPITTIDVAEMLIPLISVFSPHFLFLFAMMIAFSIGKFSRDIMLK